MCDDPRSGGCRGLFEEECVQIPLTQYYEKWAQDSFCQSVIKENVYLNEKVDLEGTDWAQGQMERVFDRFFESQGGIQTVGKADPFQDYLYGFCLDTPQACETALNTWCSSYTRESANETIINLCGCHLPASDYARYANQYAIDKSCDSLCARDTTVPYVNKDGITQLCTADICIIDDITISLVSTTIGSVNFAQACGGCTGNCRCSISNVSLSVVESELGDVNLEQECLGSLTCYESGPNNEPIEVNCETNVPVLNEETVVKNQKAVILSLIIFGALIVILGIILLLVATRKEPPPELRYG